MSRVQIESDFLGFVHNASEKALKDLCDFVYFHCDLGNAEAIVTLRNPYELPEEISKYRDCNKDSSENSNDDNLDDNLVLFVVHFLDDYNARISGEWKLIEEALTGKDEVISFTLKPIFVFDMKILHGWYKKITEQLSLEEFEKKVISPMTTPGFISKYIDQLINESKEAKVFLAKLQKLSENQ